MRLGIGVAVGVGVAAVLAAAAFSQGRPGAQQTAGKAVLIVCHGGTPPWFSNMACRLKRVFDEHLYRIYEQRPSKLGDKVFARYTTVMKRGESGPRCLQALTWALQQLSGRVTEGMVVSVFDPQATADRQVEEFCARLAAAPAGQSAGRARRVRARQL